ncbi:hypothetical protein VCUG_02646 [Vavraia culicis subsp. floridensis]|uniref:Uncharacterized protein n=1 Tax=Vavraia culicis (isolate floridensis) TaxID=948595 RepID=L2GQF2_VAVCU|nr:uncharacterized protein VCUG_02646 [Vavraia culicis subsp. floridensis]ELA45866.1 hypothetical protein VCUG_02646 [Vavraia culicis subsp. floridensis]
MLLGSSNINNELLLGKCHSKDSLEDLFISSELTISELVKSMEPLNRLSGFHIDSRSILSSFKSPDNQNDRKFQSANAGTNEKHLVESKNIAYLKHHTLHIKYV